MVLENRQLSSVKVGQSCVIESFTDDELKLKLLEMGCLPGEVVTVDRMAPMGDPDGYFLIRFSHFYTDGRG